MNELAIENHANQFRIQNGLNPAEPVRLKSLLQKLNVITVFNSLSENLSGMAVKVEHNNETYRFMLVNAAQSLGKQHFTICHELYHLFIQTEFSSQVCVTGRFDKRDPNEYHADLFASYLLLPSNGLLSNIPEAELNARQISLKTVLFLEQFFSCSRRALLFRLKKLGLIDSKTYDFFLLNIKRGALENGFPVDLYNSGNENIVIGNYGILAKELLDTEKISQSHYYTLLSEIGIDITQIESAVNGEE